MNKWLLVFFSAFLLFASCTPLPEDFIVFSGNIANSNADSLRIYSESQNKAIKLQSDGSFSDTLNVEKGYYTLAFDSIKASVFLNEGYVLHMTADANRFFSSINFAGKGADNNNLIAEKSLFINEEIGRPRDYFRLDEAAFDEKVLALQDRLENMFKDRELDSLLVEKEKKINKRWINHLRSNYQQQHKLVSSIQPGNMAPKFERFEQYGGGYLSSEDLPEGYTYFMVWSSDCQECISVFPAFNKLKEDFSVDNINFIGISVDAKKNHQRWEQWVEKYNLSGIQLHTGNGYYRKFIRDFNITGTPRYMLVNPEGKIVSAYAPTPSTRELKLLLRK